MAAPEWTSSHEQPSWRADAGTKTDGQTVARCCQYDDAEPSSRKLWHLSLVVSGGVDSRRRQSNVYDKKPQRYAKDNRTAHLIARSDKSVAYVTNNKGLLDLLYCWSIDRHEASRGLFATAELLLCSTRKALRNGSYTVLLLHQCLPLIRKRSPDGASTDWGTSNCSLLLIYLPRNDERLSRPGWLPYSGRFTHVSGYPSGAGRAHDRVRPPVKDQRSTTVPRNQPRWKHNDPDAGYATQLVNYSRL